MAKRRSAVNPNADGPPAEPNYGTHTTPIYSGVLSGNATPQSSTGPGDAPSSQSDRNAPSIASLTHSRYNEWKPTWDWLGHVLEGDGPFLDGTALVPHIREQLYKVTTDTDGKKTIDFDTVVGTKIKFEQRKAIARYENFAATIIEALVDHQYAKPIVRSAATSEGQALLDRAPIVEWWEDVDGYGTSMDEWLKFRQPLVNAYGHLIVLMDRMAVKSIRTNITPAGSKTSPTTLAEQGRPVLRFYVPSDMPDWLAPFNEQLTACKFVENVERTSLHDSVINPSRQRYIVWDDQRWTRYDWTGALAASGRHNMGELPVSLWYASRRAKIPIIGRSDLRDPKLYIDHYNMISELREILRSQTFSMLHIKLEEAETVQQARDRLGDHAGTDSLVFSRGGATYIAPADGPAAVYTSELSSLERKIYRLIGLPWEADSRDAESEGSLKQKSAGLDRLLASHADFAQKLERRVARQWFNATYGPARGPQLFKAANVSITHPDHFDVESLALKVQDARATIELNIGGKATTLLKQQVVRLALPNLTADVQTEIDKEIEAAVATDEQRSEEMHQATIAKTQQGGFGQGNDNDNGNGNGNGNG